MSRLKSLGLAVVLLLITNSLTSAAVDLNYFIATWTADGVRLDFETGSEIDHIAFNIYRSTTNVAISPTGQANLNGMTKLNDTPIRNPNGSCLITGYTYSFLDDEVPSSPDTFYYYLQSLPCEQGSSPYVYGRGLGGLPATRPGTTPPPPSDPATATPPPAPQPTSTVEPTIPPAATSTPPPTASLPLPVTVTPRPGQPTATTAPGQPTATTAPGQPTPRPGQPTTAPAPGQPTARPGQPTTAPAPGQPPVAPGQPTSVAGVPPALPGQPQPTFALPPAAGGDPLATPPLADSAPGTDSPVVAVDPATGEIALAPQGEAELQPGTTTLNGSVTLATPSPVSISPTLGEPTATNPSLVAGQQRSDPLDWLIQGIIGLIIIAIIGIGGLLALTYARNR